MKLYWNERRPTCTNCDSNFSDRRPNGYCARCWPSAKKLRAMSKWDRANPETWVGCSYRGRHWFHAGLTCTEYYDTAKSMLEVELHNRKHLEQQVHGDAPIDGLSIEHALIKLGGVLHMRDPNHYYNWATSIDHALGKREKKMVYGWLMHFLLNRPHSSFWARAYYRASERRQSRLRREAALRANTGRR